MRILECDKEAMSSTKYKSILFFTNAKAIGPCWAGQDNYGTEFRIIYTISLGNTCALFALQFLVFLV